MKKAKKKATVLEGGQQPKEILNRRNVHSADDCVNEIKMLEEIYLNRLDCYALNWQSGHYR